jgi:hypothetical protein
VCTVLLRVAPGDRWPLVLAAVRDEFLERAWDPPGPHWPASAPGLIGGRDRTGHGTWLAVRPNRPAVSALLNGVRLPPPDFGARPTRGGLPLTVLAGAPDLDEADLAGYDGFHLLVGSAVGDGQHGSAVGDGQHGPAVGDGQHGPAVGAVVWTWDGEALVRQDLPPGDHVIVNAGVDPTDSALVKHFAPLLGALPSPDPRAGLETAAAWGPWVDLLRGDGVPGDDPRALIVRRRFVTEAGDELVYGSSSASLIAIGQGQSSVRFDFTADPTDPQWYEVPT